MFESDCSDDEVNLSYDSINQHTKKEEIPNTLWVEHFKKPVQKRNPSLTKLFEKEYILLKSLYCFLEEDQVLGKILTKFGIPNICGKINKRLFKLSSKHGSKRKKYERRNKTYMPKTCVPAKKNVVKVIKKEKKDLASRYTPVVERWSDIALKKCKAKEKNASTETNAYDIIDNTSTNAKEKTVLFKDVGYKESTLPESQRFNNATATVTQQTRDDNAQSTTKTSLCVDKRANEDKITSETEQSNVWSVARVVDEPKGVLKNMGNKDSLKKCVRFNDDDLCSYAPTPESSGSSFRQLSNSDNIFDQVRGNSSFNEIFTTKANEIVPGSSKEVDHNDVITQPSVNDTLKSQHHKTDSSEDQLTKTNEYSQKATKKKDTVKMDFEIEPYDNQNITIDDFSESYSDSKIQKVEMDKQQISDVEPTTQGVTGNNSLKNKSHFEKINEDVSNQSNMSPSLILFKTAASKNISVNSDKYLNNKSNKTKIIAKHVLCSETNIKIDVTGKSSVNNAQGTDKHKNHNVGSLIQMKLINVLDERNNVQSSAIESSVTIVPENSEEEVREDKSLRITDNVCQSNVKDSDFFTIVKTTYATERSIVVIPETPSSDETIGSRLGRSDEKSHIVCQSEAPVKYEDLKVLPTSDQTHQEEEYSDDEFFPLSPSESDNVDNGLDNLVDHNNLVQIENSVNITTINGITSSSNDGEVNSEINEEEQNEKILPLQATCTENMPSNFEALSPCDSWSGREYLSEGSECEDFDNKISITDTKGSLSLKQGSQSIDTVKVTQNDGKNRIQSESMSNSFEALSPCDSWSGREYLSDGSECEDFDNKISITDTKGSLSLKQGSQSIDTVKVTQNDGKNRIQSESMSNSFEALSPCDSWSGREYLSDGSECEDFDNKISINGTKGSLNITQEPQSVYNVNVTQNGNKDLHILTSQNSEENKNSPVKASCEGEDKNITNQSKSDPKTSPEIPCKLDNSFNAASDEFSETVNNIVNYINQTTPMTEIQLTSDNSNNLAQRQQTLINAPTKVEKTTFNSSTVYDSQPSPQGHKGFECNVEDSKIRKALFPIQNLSEKGKLVCFTTESVKLLTRKRDNVIKTVEDRQNYPLEVRLLTDKEMKDNEASSSIRLNDEPDEYLPLSQDLSLPVDFETRNKSSEYDINYDCSKYETRTQSLEPPGNEIFNKNEGSLSLDRGNKVELSHNAHISPVKEATSTLNEFKGNSVQSFLNNTSSHGQNTQTEINDSELTKEDKARCKNPAIQNNDKKSYEGNEVPLEENVDHLSDILSLSISKQYMDNLSEESVFNETIHEQHTTKNNIKNENKKFYFVTDKTLTINNTKRNDSEYHQEVMVHENTGQTVLSQSCNEDHTEQTSIINLPELTQGLKASDSVQENKNGPKATCVNKTKIFCSSVIKLDPHLSQNDSPALQKYDRHDIEHHQEVMEYENAQQIVLSQSFEEDRIEQTSFVKLPELAQSVKASDSLQEKKSVPNTNCTNKTRMFSSPVIKVQSHVCQNQTPVLKECDNSDNLEENENNYINENDIKIVNAISPKSINNQTSKEQKIKRQFYSTKTIIKKVLSEKSKQKSTPSHILENKLAETANLPVVPVNIVQASTSKTEESNLTGERFKMLRTKIYESRKLKNPTPAEDKFDSSKKRITQNAQIVKHSDILTNQLSGRKTSKPQVDKAQKCFVYTTNAVSKKLCLDSVSHFQRSIESRQVNDPNIMLASNEKLHNKIILATKNKIKADRNTPKLDCKKQRDSFQSNENNNSDYVSEKRGNKVHLVLKTTNSITSKNQHHTKSENVTSYSKQINTDTSNRFPRKVLSSLNSCEVEPNQRMSFYNIAREGCKFNISDNVTTQFDNKRENINVTYKSVSKIINQNKTKAASSREEPKNQNTCLKERYFESPGSEAPKGSWSVYNSVLETNVEENLTSLDKQPSMSDIEKENMNSLISEDELRQDSDYQIVCSSENLSSLNSDDADMLRNINLKNRSKKSLKSKRKSRKNLVDSDCYTSDDSEYEVIPQKLRRKNENDMSLIENMASLESNKFSYMYSDDVSENGEQARETAEQFNMYEEVISQELSPQYDQAVENAMIDDSGHFMASRSSDIRAEYALPSLSGEFDDVMFDDVMLSSPSCLDENDTYSPPSSDNGFMSDDDNHSYLTDMFDD